MEGGAGFQDRAHLPAGLDPAVELKDEQETVKDRGKGSGKKSTPPIEKDATSDDAKDIGYGKRTPHSPCEVNETDDEKVIQSDLKKSEPPNIAYFPEEKSVDNRGQIEEADKIVELIGQRNERDAFPGKLEQQRDGQEEGQNDNAGNHQALDGCRYLLINIE